jgi:hypothetical protein
MPIGRSLAGAVRADEAANVTFLYLYVDRVDSFRFFVDLCQVFRFDRNRHLNTGH